MRARKIVFAALAIGGSLGAKPQGAGDLAMELLNMPQYTGAATFEVLLPQSLDPVTYDVQLESLASEATDSLAPCRYLIRWQTDTPGGTNSGFSAYYDGNHYRYRNNRLQEYHAEANIEPFMPAGPGSALRSGVQCTAQFADMLPQMLGVRIGEIVGDTSYVYAYHPDTIVGGRHATVVDGVKRGAGYDLMNFTYVFDCDTHLPLLTEIESSPGSISEQLITVTYRPADFQAVDINEQTLIGMYPEVFELYRESTFRAENLVNTPLPAFSCQILDSSDRYTHHLNDRFARPLVLVVLDPSVATTAETVAAVREAVDMAPMDIEVVWAFNTNRGEEISAAIGQTRPGETTLMSANSLVRNCGITMFPTTLLVDTASTVRDVIAGYNNNLGMVVLQKAVLNK